MHERQNNRSGDRQQTEKDDQPEALSNLSEKTSHNQNNPSINYTIYRHHGELASTRICSSATANPASVGKGLPFVSGYTRQVLLQYKSQEPFGTGFSVAFLAGGTHRIKE
jgi:hypothetical protein